MLAYAIARKILYLINLLVRSLAKLASGDNNNNGISGGGDGNEIIDNLPSFEDQQDQHQQQHPTFAMPYTTLDKLSLIITILEKEVKQERKLIEYLLSLPSQLH